MAEAGPVGRGAVGDAGQVYASLVAIRLAEEEVRHGSLQARGLAVVTTSGTLVALIFAVAQFALRSRVVAEVPTASRWLLTIAAGAFVVAAFGGLLANVPRDLGRPVSSEIAGKINSDWSKSTASAEKTVALTRARQLQKLERVNDTAAWYVLIGLATEVFAIALAAAAVAVAIYAK
jgi:hypothetical protein